MGEGPAPLTGYVNFRDLGRHATPVGPMRTGRLYRSDSLAHVTDEEVDHLVGNLGIRTTVDLRHESEIENYPLTALSAAGVSIHHIPLLDPSRPSVLPEDPSALTLDSMYADLLEHAGSRLVDALRVVAAEPNQPLVFMCTAGKDRTGVLAALVLGLAGVSADDIVADYAITGDAVHLIIERATARGSAVVAAGLHHLLQAEAESMERTIAWLQSQYGGFEPWALGNGYRDDEVVALRATLVQHDH